MSQIFRELFKENAMRRLVLRSLVASVGVLTGLGARRSIAQSASAYPARPVTVIVPFPPGGNLDISARIVAQAMGERLGQPFVVENKGGAGGMIGGQLVARSDPDGHVLLVGGSGPTTISPLLYAKPLYDPTRELSPIGLISIAPIALVARTGLPVANVRDLVALARKNPGKLTVASAGNGSSSHLSNELFQSMAGIKLNHVPYKGGGPAVLDVVGGQVDLLFDQVTSTMGHARQGRLRALAITSKQRSPLFPELPTVDESGVPGYYAESYTGLFGPAGLPAGPAGILSRTLMEVLHDPVIRKRFEDVGAEARATSPESFVAYLAGERARWGSVIKSAGIRAD